MQYLLVFIGGGLGAICRFGISRIFQGTETSFPWATFIANFISCLILGVFIAMLLNKMIDHKTSLFIITGFCGGFSTFSTFSYDNLKLIQDGHHFTAFLYIGLSVIICLAAILIGMKLFSEIIS